jgi:hypothetical protein
VTPAEFTFGITFDHEAQVIEHFREMESPIEDQVAALRARRKAKEEAVDALVLDS